MQLIKEPQKRVLGRGLGALLEDSIITPQSASVTPTCFEFINIAWIKCNAEQPRENFNQKALQELSNSIKVHGIIQPLTVRRLGDKTYRLIAGERRLRAAQMAGLTTVPAYIRVADDHHMLELALVENIQRASLNAIEIALSYQRLLTEFNLTQEALAERMGKDRSTVNNYLRLLKLPPDIQIALRSQKITMGHARALINIEDPTLQLSLFKKITAAALSVRAVEKLVQQLTVKKQSTKIPLTSSFRNLLKDSSWRLTQQFDTKVLIKADAQNRGALKILFDSEEELRRIVAVISNNQER